MDDEERRKAKNREKQRRWKSRNRDKISQQRTAAYLPSKPPTWLVIELVDDDGEVVEVRAQQLEDGVLDGWRRSPCPLCFSQKTAEILAAFRMRQIGLQK